MVRVQQTSDILRLMWCKCGGRHQRWSIIRRNYHAGSRLLLTITPVWKEICLSWPLQLASGYFLKFWTSYKPYAPFSTRMKRVYASMLLQEHYYVMITSALRLLEISRVLCPTKLPGPFSNTSAVRATAILGHWRG